jgi:molybdopterin-guanine dinucleotide biosynthesis protein A
LAIVACDVPHFPLDLVDRLRQALECSGHSLAVACTQACHEPPAQPRDLATPLPARVQMHWTFCLLRFGLENNGLPSRRQLLSMTQGAINRQRFRLGDWARELGYVAVDFGPTSAFENINSPQALMNLQNAKDDSKEDAD